MKNITALQGNSLYVITKLPSAHRFYSYSDIKQCLPLNNRVNFILLGLKQNDQADKTENVYNLLILLKRVNIYIMNNNTSTLNKLPQ